MIQRHGIVAVIDDDASVRESLPCLLSELGFAVRAYSSAEAFLESSGAAGVCCLIVDLAMPGMTGLDLLQALNERGLAVPAILMTAHAGDALAGRSMKSPAVATLSKPFSEAALLEAIERALPLR